MCPRFRYKKFESYVLVAEITCIFQSEKTPPLLSPMAAILLATFFCRKIMLGVILCKHTHNYKRLVFVHRYVPLFCIFSPTLFKYLPSAPMSRSMRLSVRSVEMLMHLLIAGNRLWYPVELRYIVIVQC